jgi:hypothetical protein
MFGWIERRVRNEHRKLAAQNVIAAGEGYLSSFLESDPAASTQLRQIATLAAYAQSRLGAGVALDSGTVENLLSDNMELRRLYDASPYAKLEPFDTLHQPLRGWKSFLRD